MSRNIKSYFNVVYTKKGDKKPSPVKSSKSPANKKLQVISSDEEIPKAQKKNEVKIKKKKTKVIESDSSDEEVKSMKKKAKVKTEEKLIPVNVKKLFGGKVVQSEVKNKKKKQDEDFEKTLQQLDDDFDIDESILDKSMNEAMFEESTPKKTLSKESKLKKEKSSKEDTTVVEVACKKVKHEKDSLNKDKCDNGESSCEMVNTPKKEKMKVEKDTAKVDKTPVSRKRKAEEDLDESGLDPDQERYEKKRYSAMLYKQYLNRSGPVLKGQKEMPKGKPDCLKNLCFLKTGVLESMEKDDMDILVKEHGGRTVSAVSKKVNYMVVGQDPGPSKLEKARSFGIKEITEDELLDMILVKSGMPPKYVKHSEDDDDIVCSPIKESNERRKKNLKEIEKKIKVEPKSPKKEKENKQENVKSKSPKFKEENGKVKNSKKETEEENGKVKAHILANEKTQCSGNKVKSIKNEKESKVAKSVENKVVAVKREVVEVSDDNRSWTEKYKPKDIAGIIGQQGDNSNMKKLISWLTNWYKNHSGKNRPKLVKPSPWAKNDDGAYFKCALLSGSPGVGKTTTATLVAKELGFDVVEFNASDTRSKRLLHEEVAQLLSTKSLATYFKDGSAPTKKHVLLMDEVDGMAGNEDRGGIQELIGLIKNTSVPIICMCNDRQHPKIRSLVNYCMDLRFANPRIEQIRGAMMSICFKEKVKISPDALMEVIKGAGMDIRQTLNNLSMWTAANKNLTVDTAQKESNASKKDTVIGPWEVIRKVFSEEEHKKTSIADKSKLFFYDYSIAPLFVQENYLQVVPHCNKKDLLERVASAADAISMGDIIDKKIRSTNNWSLLESQAMYSSVLPGHYMSGHFGGQINFPGWLGKNSKRTKFQRLMTELQVHMRTTASASKTAVNLDYIYYLRDSIVKPLQKEGSDGVAKSLEVMQAYNLLREDLDSILELSQWPKRKDPMASVESKVKAAFTRAYNKEGAMLPYSINTGTFKKKTSKVESDVYGDVEGEESDDNEDDDDITKDAMIKEKKKPATKTKKETGEGSKKGAGTSKGRAKKAK
ncbi:PREDICTED: replication factor C subunit 1 [Nicrophorus vespilloides]|uniref:Replication factor C subunit 1 n=1 Tax=Nicrophorus vespilloides TaxID=110193 RepID=A0ABM1MMW9_NICVS|nr:PREDICTED: replication factor C subunit 1 [Nicrophorus vespilloides]